MLFSLTCILFSGIFLGWICKKINFPSLFGMIIAGILIGPCCLNLIDTSVLAISTEIRRIALIIILLRAGLKLSLSDLKKVGRPAILMCFVPAAFEITGMIFLAPRLLGLSIVDAAILGSVIAAVSPAVIVPKMIKLMDERYGTEKSIPQMILAGASVDDVFVIVMFTTFTGMAQGNGISLISLANIPVSIITGIAAGLATGLLVCIFFEKKHMRDTVKISILLGISFALVTFESIYSEIIPFASLIAIMALGLEIKRKNDALAVRLSKKYDRMWVIAEVFLFVLVGASVAIQSAMNAGINTLILLFAVLVFRMAGVAVCMIKTNLEFKERIFCMLAYTPKATVQAAIGGLPLAMGLPCGNIILTVSVIAILVTAPLGAFAIEATYKKWLQK